MRFKKIICGILSPWSPRLSQAYNTSLQAQNIRTKISTLTDENINKIQAIEPFPRIHKLIKDIILICHGEPDVADKYIQASAAGNVDKLNIKSCLCEQQLFLMHPKTSEIAKQYEYDLPVIHLTALDYYMRDILMLAEVEESLLYRYAC